jgi:hypothetical protein
VNDRSAHGLIVVGGPPAPTGVIGAAAGLHIRELLGLAPGASDADVRATVAAISRAHATTRELLELAADAEPRDVEAAIGALRERSAKAEACSKAVQNLMAGRERAFADQQREQSAREFAILATLRAEGETRLVHMAQEATEMASDVSRGLAQLPVAEPVRPPLAPNPESTEIVR